MAPSSPKRDRPLSPNIQVYRPQLTSVLSIVNRVTGVFLSGCAILLVIWLAAAASGQDSYSQFQRIIGSWPGQSVLLATIFAFFLHFCGGIRHLIWDSVQAFELRQIYTSGWIVVIASVTLTLISWVISLVIAGQS